MDNKEIFNKLLDLVFNGDIDKLLINVGLVAEEYYTILSKYIVDDTFDDIEYNGVDWDYHYEIKTSNENKYFVSGSSRWGYIEITKMLPVPMENFMAAYDDGLDVSYIKIDILKYIEKHLQEKKITINQFEIQKLIDDSDVEDSALFIQKVINKIQDTLEVFIATLLDPTSIKNAIIKSNKHYIDLDEDGRLIVRFSEKYQERKSGGTVRIIIAGGRDFVDADMLNSEVVDYIEKQNLGNSIIEIVSGMAKGADRLAVEFARSKGYKLKEMPADWNNKGKAAGYLRNEEMAIYAKGGYLIAFWDGYSNGTKHMIDMGDKHDLKVHIVKYEVEKNSIDWLKGQYGFLSMFSATTGEPIIYKSEVYLCGEAAFQAQKIEVVDDESAKVQKAFCKYTGYTAKEQGKLLPLRKDWEEVKYQILEEINYAKFSRNEKLRNQLLSTGDLSITECNFWHDNEYGDCKCQRCKDIPGKNILGKTLMRVRDRIKQEETNDNR